MLAVFVARLLRMCENENASREIAALPGPKNAGRKNVLVKVGNWDGHRGNAAYLAVAYNQ